MPTPSAATQPETLTLARPIPYGTDANLAVPETLRIATDPRREVLPAGGQGGGWGWYPTLIRALPPYVDDVSRDFPRTYEEMLLDPQVRSVVDLRRMAILAQGWKLNPAVPDDPAAEPIRAFCEEVLKATRTPFIQLLFDLLSALPFGWALAEHCWEDRVVGGVPRLVLGDVAPKSIYDGTVAVDAYGHDVGVLPRWFGVIRGAGQILAPGPDDTIPGLVRRDKFCIHRYQADAHHLLGQSCLRAVWYDWWFKQQITPEYLKYLVQFGSGTWVGEIEADVRPNPEKDAQGNNTGRLIYPEESLGTALAALHNGAWAALPPGMHAHIEHPVGDGKPFLEAYDLKDRQIAKTVLLQTLTTEEGEHMARAASETHQDVFGIVLRWDRQSLEATIRRDTLTPLVRFNFGDAAAQQYTPYLDLGTVEHQDFQGDAQAIAALESSGFLHRSQRQGIDQELGLTPRDWAQEQADYERAQANAALQAAALAAADKAAAKVGGRQMAGSTQDEGITA